MGLLSFFYHEKSGHRRHSFLPFGVLRVILILGVFSQELTSSGFSKASCPLTRKHWRRIFFVSSYSFSHSRCSVLVCVPSPVREGVCCWWWIRNDTSRRTFYLVWEWSPVIKGSNPLVSLGSGEGWVVRNFNQWLGVETSVSHLLCSLLERRGEVWGGGSDIFFLPLTFSCLDSGSSFYRNGFRQSKGFKRL